MGEPSAPGATTVDHLPALDEPVALDHACIAEVRDLGHTVVRGLATADEVAAYRPVIEEVVREASRDAKPVSERDTYGQAFLQVHNLCFRDERVRRFAFAARFAKVAAELLGADGVRLYHDQALFKEAGGGYTPWHQDQAYWPLSSDRCITMWMPLVDVPAEVGSMTFADGSHLHGDLGPWVIGDRSEVEFDRIVAERGFPTSTHGAVAAGDATFHKGWTLHRAPANGSDLLRSVMTVIYLADGMRVGEPDSFFRELDHKIWLGGAPVGSVIEGDRNPRLWPPA